MKKVLVFAIVIMEFCVYNLFAQNLDDDRPYLSEDDIRSIEMVLSDDVPEQLVQLDQSEEPEEFVDEIQNEIVQNEFARLNNQKKIYHLMVLDRKFCDPKVDITDVPEVTILYKYGNLGNGYFLLLCEVPEKGPVFPLLPEGSFIILDLMSNRINTIKEYVNSDLFRRFISNRRVLSELGRVLNKL